MDDLFEELAADAGIYKKGNFKNNVRYWDAIKFVEFYWRPDSIRCRITTWVRKSSSISKGI